MRIGIIGAGHAGIEAAKAARAGGADTVVVYSNEGVLPYSRPKLVALAFSQVQPEEMLQKPASWYRENGIDLRLATPVTGLRPDIGGVVTAAGEEQFDALVLACGAEPLQPPIPAPPNALLPLWSQAQALAVRDRLPPGATVLVLGGGVLGIETALRAAQAGFKPVLVEKMPSLMSAQFTQAAGAVIRSMLESKGVSVHTGAGVTAVSAGEGGCRFQLDQGGTLDACCAILSIGARPNLSLARAAGLGGGTGVAVDAFLQAAPCLFAAGDLTQLGGGNRCSVREALAQGRVAGANAAAAAAGKPLQNYQSQPIPLQFMFNDFMLCSVGDSGVAAGAEVETLPAPPAAYRALIRRAARLAGVQMVGTKQEFDHYVRQLESGALNGG
ncbi:MAG: FAD-dependent oxidoreductase [Lentisphaeria bacterium]